VVGAAAGDGDADGIDGVPLLPSHGAGAATTGEPHVIGVAGHQLTAKRRLALLPVLSDGDTGAWVDSASWPRGVHPQGLKCAYLRAHAGEVNALFASVGAPYAVEANGGIVRRP
jgi:hypothetical protein